jgi:hypothetical protein
MRLLSRWLRRPGRPVYHQSCPGCTELGVLVQSEDVAGLIDVLKTDRRHQTEALASLRYVTGRDFGTDPAAWKSWCRKQKTLDGAAAA